MSEVSSLRFGFATNSSSSHSIVVLPGAENDIDDGEFGWGFFTAASVESKRRYAAALLRRALGEVMPEVAAGLLTRACFPGHEDDDYVDHQSTFVIPCDYGTDFPSLRFAEEMAAFLSRPDVAILGGNDNTEDSHHLSGKGKVVPHFKVLPREREASNYVCRRNERGDWTVFGRRGGTKVRLAFGATDQSLGGKPELVDVKVTDHCTFGCPMCYQDSTHNGKDAKMAAVQSLAVQLREAQVFEVAIGGGEPTTMPNFREVVRVFADAGLSVSFTTRNLKFLQREEWWKDECRGVGVSLPVSPDGDDSFMMAVAAISHDLPCDDWPNVPRVALHVVPGMCTEYRLRRVVKMAESLDLRLLLLGWKASGRAGTVPPRDGEDRVAEILASEKLGALGVDTEMAAKLKASGAMSDVPPNMYEVADGTSSWYYDLVSMRSGPSSYGETKPVPFKFGQADFDVPWVPLASPITEAAP